MSRAKQNGPAQQDGVRRREVFGLSAAGATGALVAASAMGSPLIRQARAQSTAGSRLQTVLERGHVIVGTGSTNPPWHFEDEAAARRHGHRPRQAARQGLFEDPEKVEFVLGAADARIPNLVTDKVDVIFQFMTITPGRAQQAEFTIPYYREGVGFMMMKGADHQTFDDLKAGGATSRSRRCRTCSSRSGSTSLCPRPRSTSTTASTPRSRRSTPAGRRRQRSTSRRSAGCSRSSPTATSIPATAGCPTPTPPVKPGDQVWLNFVNTVLHEAMTGVEFLSYQASLKWFGQQIEPPRVGFPVEYS